MPPTANQEKMKKAKQVASNFESKFEFVKYVSNK